MICLYFVWPSFFAADSGGNNRFNNKKWERTVVERFEFEVCVYCRLCSGAVRCRFGHSIASSGAESSSKTIDLRGFIERPRYCCSRRGISSFLKHILICFFLCPFSYTCSYNLSLCGELFTPN